MPVCLSLVTLLCSARVAAAQNTPAAGSPPPDDTPSIKVGAVIYPDYTYTLNPTTIDSDGNAIHLSQFSVTRGYINITGNISHLVAFRITPDVARETSSFSDISGSLEFRVKYAYLQLNLDDWIKGSYVRFGIQQTPWLDFAEGIYRYRFQGTMFAEREQTAARSSFLVSSDAGASFHYEFDYGDVHVGVFNGENYNKAEVNNEKSFQVRATLRPFANPSTPQVLRGIRGSVFFDADHYVKNAPRNRFIGSVTFEHPHLNAAFELLDTADQTSITKPEVDGRGYSIWATPKSSNGLEGLIRYDHMKPNTLVGAQVKNRTIVGVAYWFPHQGNVSSALLLDYDGQTFDNFTPAQPRQSKLAVHGLISF